MVDVCKLGARVWAPLLTFLMMSALLAVWIWQREDAPPTSAAPLDDWDIARLTAYLNAKGLSLRLVSTRQDGAIHQSVFLTTTDKGWDDLSHLFKNSERIGEWRGTLYCERSMAADDLARQWSDYSSVAGPFLFYGDPALLARVRGALAPLVPSEDRLRPPTK